MNRMFFPTRLVLILSLALGLIATAPPVLHAFQDASGTKTGTTASVPAAT